VVYGYKIPASASGAPPRQTGLLESSMTTRIVDMTLPPPTRTVRVPARVFRTSLPDFSVEWLAGMIGLGHQT
jgi:hypothetical protein